MLYHLCLLLFPYCCRQYTGLNIYVVLFVPLLSEYQVPTP